MERSLHIFVSGNEALCRVVTWRYLETEHAYVEASAEQFTISRDYVTVITRLFIPIMKVFLRGDDGELKVFERKSVPVDCLDVEG